MHRPWQQQLRGKEFPPTVVRAGFPLNAVRCLVQPACLPCQAYRCACSEHARHSTVQKNKIKIRKSRLCRVSTVSQPVSRQTASGLAHSQGRTGQESVARHKTKTLQHDRFVPCSVPARHRKRLRDVRTECIYSRPSSPHPPLHLSRHVSCHNSSINPNDPPSPLSCSPKAMIARNTRTGPENTARTRHRLPVADATVDSFRMRLRGWRRESGGGSEKHF